MIVPIFCSDFDGIELVSTDECKEHFNSLLSWLTELIYECVVTVKEQHLYYIDIIVATLCNFYSIRKGLLSKEAIACSTDIPSLRIDETDLQIGSSTSFSRASFNTTLAVW